MYDREQILQMIRQSVHTADPEAEVILYGSQARGDYRLDSDFDILVLLNKDKITNADEARIGYPLFKLELSAGVAISPVIYSKTAWQTRHRISPFYKNVMREGVML
jgi:uncharacterized protein